MPGRVGQSEQPEGGLSTVNHFPLHSLGPHSLQALVLM